jgi:hypothetical protein
MSNSLTDDLASLLHVEPGEVNGLLEELGVDGCSPQNGVSISFNFIRFQNDVVRLDHFLEKICNHIIPYCLRRDKLSWVKRSSEWRPIYIEAKKKFAQRVDGKSGEPGELIGIISIGRGSPACSPSAVPAV